MRGKWWVLLIFLVGCAEDNFPGGLYDYQVERLLSGGDSKVWMLVSELENGVASFPSICSDSTRLLITLTSLDSVNIVQLIPNIICDAFDTLKLGNANASGDLLFTDSLRFASGEYWYVQSITGTKLEVFTSASKLENFSIK